MYAKFEEIFADSYGGFSELILLNSVPRLTELSIMQNLLNRGLLQLHSVCYRLIRRNNVECFNIWMWNHRHYSFKRFLTFHLTDTVTVNCISTNDNHQKQDKLSGSNFV